MPNSSPEILQLEAIRDWMATLAVWSEWCATADVPTLKSRVVWPLKAAPTLPVCVLSLAGGRTVNLTGAAGGANFQPSGQIKLWIYAADTAPADPEAGYTAFADLFFRLISEMADKAHEAPVFFNEFSTPDLPIVHSTWVNSEGDDADPGLSAWYQGELQIRWGVNE